MLSGNLLDRFSKVMADIKISDSYTNVATEKATKQLTGVRNTISKYMDIGHRYSMGANVLNNINKVPGMHKVTRNEIVSKLNSLQQSVRIDTKLPPKVKDWAIKEIDAVKYMR